jgi:8-oxo-dGTP pyrophosphatase MutT (NUDIX family)
MGSAGSGRVRRVSARLVPVNDRGEVLLLHGRDPARPDDWYWFTIGGAVEAGETPQEAAVRELHEETGIVASPDELTDAFHHGVHAFSYDGVDYDGEATFYALPMTTQAGDRVHFDGLEEAEVGNVVAARWWAPADLVDVPLSNLDLPRLMALAVEAVR